MHTYADYVPTAFDSHIEIEDRENWLLAPVSQTRDSGVLTTTNFQSVCDILDDFDLEYEIHRFGHWGPGWYEIILVSPTDTAQTVLQDISAALENYPVLDDEKLSENEYDLRNECWDNYGSSDLRRRLESALEGLFQDDLDFDSSFYSDQHYCQHFNMPISLCLCGDCIFTIEQAISQAIDALDSADLSDVMFQEFIAEEFLDSSGDSFIFRFVDLDTDTALALVADLVG